MIYSVFCPPLLLSWQWAPHTTPVFFRVLSHWTVFGFDLLQTSGVCNMNLSAWYNLLLLICHFRPAGMNLFLCDTWLSSTLHSATSITAKTTKTTPLLLVITSQEPTLHYIVINIMHCWPECQERTVFALLPPRQPHTMSSFPSESLCLRINNVTQQNLLRLWISYLSGEIQRTGLIAAAVHQRKQTCASVTIVLVIIHLDYKNKSCNLEEWSAS